MKTITKNNIPVARLAIILGALATFGAFGTDMYLSGFPAIAEYFHTSVANVQISLSVYFFGLAVGQMIYGPLVDRFGRRKPLLVGLSVFVTASILLAVAPNVQCFIGLRLMQALGGCSGMIIGRAVVSDLFNLRESANVLSMLAVVQGLGPIIAPVMGSYLLTVSVWQSVFIFLTGFGLVCFVASAAGLPETLPAEKQRKLSAGTIVRDYASMFVNRDFIVPALASAMAGSCLFAYIAGSPFVFMHIYGMSAGQYGLIFAANAASTILAANINRLLLRHFSPQTVLTRALVFNICTILALLILAGRAPMWAFMIPLWFCIASIPMIFANGMAIAMSASRERAGSASAIIGLLQFGMASIFSSMVSFLDNGTAYPMIGVMLAGVVLGAATNALAKKRQG